MEGQHFGNHLPEILPFVAFRVNTYSDWFLNRKEARALGVYYKASSEGG